MAKNQRNLFKNTIIIGIGTICTKLISFIMIPFYTKWLSPDEYGDYDLIISYLTLLIPIITLQLEQAVFRFTLKKKEKSKNYLVNALNITLINIILVDILALILLKNSIFKCSFILYFDAYAVFVVLSEYLRGNEKLREYSFYNIISSINIVLLSVVFVAILHLGANGLMYAYAASYIIVDIIIIIKLKLIFFIRNYEFNKIEYKEMFRYSIPMIPNGISWWITNVSDRTIINYFIGSYYNGIYAIACKIPTVISLIYSIFNLSWQQTAIISYNDSDKSEYFKEILKKLITFLFTTAFVLIGVLPFLVEYVLDKQYFDTIYYAPILLLGSIFLCLGQFLGGIFLATNNTKKIGYTTIIAASINIVINLSFIQKYGLVIACISTLFSYIYFYFRRYFLIKDVRDKENIYLIIKYVSLYIVFYIIFSTLKNNVLLIILNIIIWIVYFISNKEIIKLCINKIKLKNKEI